MSTDDTLQGFRMQLCHKSIAYFRDKIDPSTQALLSFVGSSVSPLNFFFCRWGNND